MASAGAKAQSARLDADWLRAPATRAVMAMLTGAGHSAYFVGGSVRNTLLSVPVDDIDISTDALPDQVLTLAERAGLRAVPTGIDHGTVTLVNDSLAHEVTTFRRDVATDGRRAVVAFTTLIEEDAARRDFTMNALYADAEGAVVDPLGGLPDLRARLVRFVGDPHRRIAEDGLRVLRFFRFAAIYGDPAQGFDPAGLAAVAEADGALRPVSRERIGVEMVKLLGAADPAPALSHMQRTAVLGRVLPDADPAPVHRLVALEQAHGISPGWHRRLAVLGAPKSMQDWLPGLRLSRADTRRLEAISTAQSEDLPLHAAAERFGAKVATDAALVGAARSGSALPDAWQGQVEHAAAARFPVTAKDLLGSYGAGPELGAALSRLHAAWVDSRFTLDRAALLALDPRCGSTR